VRARSRPPCSGPGRGRARSSAWSRSRGGAAPRPDGAPARDAGGSPAWLRAPAEAEDPGRAGGDGRRGRPRRTPRRHHHRGALPGDAGWRSARRGTAAAPALPSLRAAFAAAGVVRRLALAIAGFRAQLALLAGLWWAVGARAVATGGGGALRGLGFIVIILALVAARLGSSWLAGRLAIDVGAVLRDRLLHGILALDTEPIRAEGIGQLLGRVVETEALEALALGGGLMAAAGLFELATGVVVLALGLGARGHLPLVGVWLAVGTALAALAQRRLGRWSELRVGLTHDLVERMVGQRTLVAQQAPELRDLDRNAALDAYAAAGRMLDRALAALSVVVPRGWLLTAVAASPPGSRAPAPDRRLRHQPRRRAVPSTARSS
jgi:hypothetical protein